MISSMGFTLSFTGKGMLMILMRFGTNRAVIPNMSRINPTSINSIMVPHSEYRFSVFIDVAYIHTISPGTGVFFEHRHKCITNEKEG